MGTLIGSTFRDAQAIEFNGSTQYAYIDDPSFKSDTQGAFAFWYRPTTVLAANGFEGFFGYGVKDAANNSILQFVLRRDVSFGAATYLEVTIRENNGGTPRFYIGGTALSAATWYHLVFQSSGTTTTVYINGVAETLLLRSGTIATPSNTTNNGEWLGDISGTNHRMTFGSRFISNAASSFNDNRTNECIYVSRPLTSGEITALYNGGTPRNPHRVTTLGSDWKSWWRFGDSRDDATTVYDERGSNNLTLVASPSYVTP